MGRGSPKRAERALGVPGSAPQVQVLSLRPKSRNPNLFSIGDGFGFFVFFDSTERYVRNKRGESANEHSDKEYTEPMSGESILPDDIKTGRDEV